MPSFPSTSLARTGAALLALAAACVGTAALTDDGVAPRAEAAARPAPGPADARDGRRLRAATLDRPSARFALGGPRGTIVQRNVRFMPLSLDDPVIDVYRRAGQRGAPAVLLIHGGGWHGGGKRRMASVARAVARAGLVAVNLDYTLADAYRPGFPGQLREVDSAVRWIRRNARRLGVDRTRVGALGSSAGGHLATLLATSGTGPLSAGGRVAAAVAWSAPLDLPGLSGHLMLGNAARTLIGCGPWTCPATWADASPIAHVSPDDPPLLLVNSRQEMVSVRQPVAMAERLTSAGVPHELWLLEGRRHAREYADTALERSVRFLRDKLLQ